METPHEINSSPAHPAARLRLGAGGRRRLSAQAGQTVKIAFIDPLSGLTAPTSARTSCKSWQFVAEKFNAKNPAGVKFEIVVVRQQGLAAGER